MSTMGAAVNWAAEHDELRIFKYLVSKSSFPAQNQRQQWKYSFNFNKENAPRGAFPKRLARAQSGFSVVSLVGRAGRPLSSEGPARARARARAR